MSEQITTRRTVMKTAAWSVPVIVTAAAAPAASASEQLQIAITDVVSSYDTSAPYCESSAVITLVSGSWPPALAIRFNYSPGEDPIDTRFFYAPFSNPFTARVTEPVDNYPGTHWTTCAVSAYFLDPTTLAVGEQLAIAAPVAITGP